MMDEVIGEVEVELDGRFSSIRTKETNLGELLVNLCHSLENQWMGFMVCVTKKWGGIILNVWVLLCCLLCPLVFVGFFPCIIPILHYAVIYVGFKVVLFISCCSEFWKQCVQSHIGLKQRKLATSIYLLRNNQPAALPPCCLLSLQHENWPCNLKGCLTNILYKSLVVVFYAHGLHACVCCTTGASAKVTFFT